ncbi:HPr family phosphocarrier protein [Mollicutes bacterium LVI A0039]|nr:HPr family phosphocarrier protein [Mollicutes bacterium LVI A0039]
MNKSFVITDPVGLHARPATLLVNEAGKFASEAKIVVEGKEANLKSIMGVMSLAISNGVEFEVVTEGDDAAEALNAIAEVITRNNIGEAK